MDINGKITSIAGQAQKKTPTRSCILDFITKCTLVFFASDVRDVELIAVDVYTLLRLKQTFPNYVHSAEA